MSTHKELDILMQALEANLKILDKCVTTNIKDKNLVMLSVIIELRSLCDKVIIPLKENVDI